jgi:hypothetical protein
VAAKVVLRRVHVRCNATCTDSCLGSDITEQEAEEATCVLTNKEMDDAKNQGNDIVCIIRDSSDLTFQDRLLLVGRILPTSSLLGKVELKPDSLFKTLKGRLPKNGCNPEGQVDSAERQGLTKSFLSLCTMVGLHAGKASAQLWRVHMTIETGISSTRAHTRKILKECATAHQSFVVKWTPHTGRQAFVSPACGWALKKKFERG